MYCRSCGYPLAGLDTTACPECARPFDPANASSVRHRPLPERGLRQHLLGLGVAVGIAAVAWFTDRLLDGAGFTTYHATLFSYLGVGLILAAVAALAAALIPTWPARLLLLPLGILCGWASVVVGVGRGFDAWQSQPNPPDEAFNDGGPLVGSVLIGWIPGTIVVAVVFGVVMAVVWARSARPPRASAISTSAATATPARVPPTTPPTTPPGLPPRRGTDADE